MNTDPVEYPKVTIRGQEYEVKFRASDVIRLKKEHKIDLMSGDGMTFRGAEALEMVATVISIGIAHQAKITPAEILDDAEIDNWGDLFVAVQAAQKKALDRSMEKIRAAQEAGKIFKPADRPQVIQPAPVPEQIQ